MRVPYGEGVAGHTNGSSVASIDQTIDYTYDGDNHVLRMTAEAVVNQITQYGYGYSGSGTYLLGFAGEASASRPDHRRSRYVQQQ